MEKFIALMMSLRLMVECKDNSKLAKKSRHRVRSLSKGSKRNVKKWIVGIP